YLDDRASAVARPRVGAHAYGQQQTMEALRVDRRIERDRVLRDARDTEVVADAADAEDQRVVAQRPRRQDLVAVVELHRRELELPRGAIESNHFALAKAEAMPVRKRQIDDVVHVA